MGGQFEKISKIVARIILGNNRGHFRKRHEKAILGRSNELSLISQVKIRFQAYESSQNFPRATSYVLILSFHRSRYATSHYSFHWQLRFSIATPKPTPIDVATWQRSTYRFLSRFLQISSSAQTRSLKSNFYKFYRFTVDVLPRSKVEMTFNSRVCAPARSAESRLITAIAARAMPINSDHSTPILFTVLPLKCGAKQHSNRLCLAYPTLFHFLFLWLWVWKLIYIYMLLV